MSGSDEKDIFEYVKNIRRNRIKKKSVLSRDIMLKHYGKYNADDVIKQLKFGKFVLYETSDSDMITYPRLGIYYNTSTLDMAICHNILDSYRTWDNNYTFEFGGYDQWLMEFVPSVTEHISWNDSIYIYGIYDKLPTWQELKPAYEKTLWFYLNEEELRDREIKRILK